MQSLCLLAIAALAGMNLAAAETKAPPASARPNAAVPAFATPMRPDLKITAKPNNGIGPLFDFKIENLGNVPSKEAAIQFWVTPPCARPSSLAGVGSGKLFKTGKVKALVVTTSPSYAFSYSFEMPGYVRGCALKVIVDSDKEVLEVKEDNNEAIVQTLLPPAPDLVARFQAGYQSIPKVVVKNQGNATAGASVVRLSCSSNEAGHPCDPVGKTNGKMWTWDVPSLPAGQEFSVNSPISSQYKDLLTVVADVNHQVGEWEENNNTWTGH